VHARSQALLAANVLLLLLLLLLLLVRLILVAISMHKACLCL
jgi:hypothetical protein